jgi:hypothetical protein
VPPPCTPIPVDTLVCQITPAFTIPPYSKNRKRKKTRVDSARVAGIIVNEQVAAKLAIDVMVGSWRSYAYSTSTIPDGPALCSMSFLRINVCSALHASRKSATACAPLTATAQAQDVEVRFLRGCQREGERGRRRDARYRPRRELGARSVHAAQALDTASPPGTAQPRAAPSRARQTRRPHTRAQATGAPCTAAQPRAQPGPQRTAQRARYPRHRAGPTQAAAG